MSLIPYSRYFFIYILHIYEYNFQYIKYQDKLLEKVYRYIINVNLIGCLFMW